MKKFFKSFIVLPAVFVICLSAFMLGGCGSKSKDKNDVDTTAKLTVSSTVKAETETVINFIKNKIYNNSATFATQKSYTVQEIKAKGGDYADFTYYVELGTLENFGNVASINFNGTAYKSNDNVFKLSVGNDNFIVDNAYYVDSANKLYVAAPVIAFETTLSSKIKINDKEFDINFEPATASLNVTGAKFQTGSKSSIVRVGETNEFNATIKDFNKWIEFGYSNSASTDVFLTKKVLDGKLLSYGFTVVDDSADGYVLAFYPNYKSNPTEAEYNEIRTKLDGKTLDYFIYCAGKGSAKLKINYTIPAYEA